MLKKTKKLTILDIIIQENGFTVKIYTDKYKDYINFEEWEISKTKEDLININAKNREIQTLIKYINFNPHAAYTNAIQNFGEYLYNQIFPSENPDLRERISQIDTPLLICSNTPEISWELLHDSNNFFADKYSLSRYFHKIEGEPYTPVKKHERCLIIASPLLLEDAEQEKKSEQTIIEQNILTLIDYLEKNGLICELVASSGATRKKVIDRFREQKYRIIHYFGHIRYDEKGAYLELYGGDRLYANDIEEVKGAKFVFLNGCTSATLHRNMNDMDNKDSDLKNSQKDPPPPDSKSIADAFLINKAEVVIGTIADVPVTGAGILARNFYKYIFEGCPVGEALKRARSKVKKNKFGATWASYLMIGDPRKVIRLPIIKLLWKWLKRNLHYFILTFLILWLTLYLLWPKIIIEGRFDDWNNILITKFQDKINECQNINGDCIEVRIINDNGNIFFWIRIGGQFAENIFYSIFLGDLKVRNGFNFCGRSNEIGYLYLIERDPNGDIWFFIYNGEDGCIWRWERICLIPEYAYSKDNNMVEIKLPIEKINNIDISSLFFVLHTNGPDGADIDFAPDTWYQEGYKYKYRNMPYWTLKWALIISLVLSGIGILFKLLDLYLKGLSYKR